MTLHNFLRGNCTKQMLNQFQPLKMANGEPKRKGEHTHIQRVLRRKLGENQTTTTTKKYAYSGSCRKIYNFNLSRCHHHQRISRARSLHHTHTHFCLNKFALIFCTRGDSRWMTTRWVCVMPHNSCQHQWMNQVPGTFDVFGCGEILPLPSMDMHIQSARVSSNNNDRKKCEKTIRQRIIQ